MSNTFLVKTLDGGSWCFDPITKTARFKEVKSVSPLAADMTADLNFFREMGQKEAWELAGRFLKPENKGGYSGKDVDDMFGRSMMACDPIVNYSYAEVADKVSEWKKNKNIKVGDVIELPNGEKRVVVDRDYNSIYALTKDGKVMILPMLVNCKKTGKSVDIFGILEKLMED